MITLRFVSHPGIFNWACRIAEYGFWCTHCEAVMPDGKLLGAMSDGVKARLRDYDAGKFKEQMFVNLKATQEQENRFYSFLTRQLGKPYDAISIASFFTGRDWQEPDAWFCSELQAAALSDCGLFPQHMAVEFSRITPRDLMLLASGLGGGDNV